MNYKILEKKKTKATRKGSALHCLLLEGEEEFEKRYLVSNMKEPDSPEAKRFCRMVLDGYSNLDALKESGYSLNGDLQKKADRTYKNYSRYLETALDLRDQGLELLPVKDYELAIRQRNQLLRNKSARYVLDRITTTEREVRWKTGGFSWLGYLDGEGEGLVLDLKTIYDATPRKVRNTILYDDNDHTSSGKYLRQSAHYTIGRGMSPSTEYYVIAIDGNLEISVFELDFRRRLVAWEDIKRCLHKFRYCLKEGLWRDSFDFWVKDGIYQL
jgi:hypothetical protein